MIRSFRRAPRDPPITSGMPLAQMDLRGVMRTVSVGIRDPHTHDSRLYKEMEHDIWIEMDSQHLRQVLWNLRLNAAEAIDGQEHIVQ